MTFGLNAAPYEADEKANSREAMSHDACQMRLPPNLLLPGGLAGFTAGNEYESLIEGVAEGTVSGGYRRGVVENAMRASWSSSPSNPTAHVAPCTSLNVGDKGVWSAFYRALARLFETAATFGRLAYRLRRSLR